MIKPEYEIKDISINESGNSFRVTDSSNISVDKYGEPKNEYFQFDINDLNNEKVWKNIISQIMLRRAIAEDKEDELDDTTPQGGFQKLTPFEKSINRLNRINNCKKKFVGKVDLSEEFNKQKSINMVNAKILRNAKNSIDDGK